MPPDLGHKYPATWEGNPPHMAAMDLPLWALARPMLAPRVTAWYFDVAVGEGSGPPTDPGDAIALGYYRISRMRIDAVGETPAAWLLIEIRPNAGLGALGSIQTYRSLWERDPPDSRPVQGWLITNRYQADVARTAINAGIRLQIL